MHSLEEMTTPGKSDRQGMGQDEGEEDEQDHPGAQPRLHHPLQEKVVIQM